MIGRIKDCVASGAFTARANGNYGGACFNLLWRPSVASSTDGAAVESEVWWSDFNDARCGWCNHWTPDHGGFVPGVVSPAVQ